jgi:hypothetical protein
LKAVRNIPIEFILSLQAEKNQFGTLFSIKLAVKVMKNQLDVTYKTTQQALFRKLYTKLYKSAF